MKTPQGRQAAVKELSGTAWTTAADDCTASPPSPSTQSSNFTIAISHRHRIASCRTLAVLNHAPGMQRYSPRQLPGSSTSVLSTRWRYAPYNYPEDRSCALLTLPRDRDARRWQIGSKPRNARSPKSRRSGVLCANDDAPLHPEDPLPTSQQPKMASHWLADPLATTTCSAQCAINLRATVVSPRWTTSWAPYGVLAACAFLTYSVRGTPLLV